MRFGIGQKTALALRKSREYAPIPRACPYQKFKFSELW
jgi:hypothetical protein